MAVKHKHGRAVWQHVEIPITAGALSSGKYALSHHQAPHWTHDVEAITGAVLGFFGGPVVHSSSALSTGAIHAILTIERTYPTAPVESRVRYDDYLLVRAVSGRWFQAGPDKDVDGRHHPGLRHHNGQRSQWFADLYTCSTSTGW